LDVAQAPKAHIEQRELFEYIKKRSALNVGSMSANDQYLDLAGALNDLGVVAMMCNELEASLSHFRRGLMMADRAYRPHSQLRVCLSTNLLEAAMRIQHQQKKEQEEHEEQLIYLVDSLLVKLNPLNMVEKDAWSEMRIAHIYFVLARALTMIRRSQEESLVYFNYGFKLLAQVKKKCDAQQDEEEQPDAPVSLDHTSSSSSSSLSNGGFYNVPFANASASFLSCALVDLAILLASRRPVVSSTHLKHDELGALTNQRLSFATSSPSDLLLYANELTRHTDLVGNFFGASTGSETEAMLNALMRTEERVWRIDVTKPYRPLLMGLSLLDNVFAADLLHEEKSDKQ